MRNVHLLPVVLFFAGDDGNSHRSAVFIGAGKTVYDIIFSLLLWLVVHDPIELNLLRIDNDPILIGIKGDNHF